MIPPVVATNITITQEAQMTTIYRQGDVLIREVSAIPAGAKTVPREGGAVVLAHGEVTGHSHAIGSEFAHLVAEGAQRFLRATRPVALRHEEHGEIILPAGQYEVVIQREWSPSAIRNVED